MRADGCEVSFPEFPPQTYCPPFAGVHSLIEADPELILIVNTFSTDPYVLGKTFSTHLKIPKLDWFMDAPVIGWDHLKRAGLGYGEILASTDACWCDEVRDACPAIADREAHGLPLAATYEEPGPEDPSWSCDVSYVGQVRDMSFLFANPRLDARVRSILDKIVRAMLQGKGQRLDRWVRSSPLLAELRAQYDLETFLKTYYLQMIWEANSRYRFNTLKPLAKLGLRIFGNEDWRALTTGTSLEKCFTGKTVAHEDLPRLFRNSKINVNMHHLQSSTSLNLRVFDVPAAGGFLITDSMPGLADLFEIGREVVVYRTPEELREKVKHYLSHPEERLEIARRARQRVLRDHTFKNRWQQVRDILRKEGW
jgi:spore maturation protein CgeB